MHFSEKKKKMRRRYHDEEVSTLKDKLKWLISKFKRPLMMLGRAGASLLRIAGSMLKWFNILAGAREVYQYVQIRTKLQQASRAIDSIASQILGSESEAAFYQSGISLAGKEAKAAFFSKMLRRLIGVALGIIAEELARAARHALS